MDQFPFDVSKAGEVDTSEWIPSGIVIFPLTPPPPPPHDSRGFVCFDGGVNWPREGGVEEGCAQEQKRVALGRGHQDAEAIDAARQAPPPTLSNPLRFLPPSRYLSLSLFISLSISSRDRYLRSSPPSSPPHYVSIYVWMHLKQRRRGKSSRACSTRRCSTFGARNQLFSPGLLDITLRFHGRDEYVQAGGTWESD